jgi:prephenate dehydrogenase
MSAPIGILGFGRFGAALAELARDTGKQVRAWDPHLSVPSTYAVANLTDLAQTCRTLVLAVPVEKIAGAALALRPEVTTEHFVLHVASVQDGANHALQQVFGETIPWAGSHPLFGPSSLAMGERPLQVVVCRNDARPQHTQRAVDFYHSLGCEVLTEYGPIHDRCMAYSHALTFFVAKGMLDLGEIDRLSFSPPSFRSMQATIDSVRADASHLFLSIERANPYAAEARQKLLEALGAIHGQLEETPIEGADSETLFPIPDLGQRAPELCEARDLIDEVDQELIGLLARRAFLARRIGQIKIDHGHGVRDPKREKNLLESRKRLAEQSQLDPDGVAAVFEAVMKLARGTQDRILDDSN